MRNDSRSPVFQSRKIVGDLGRRRAEPVRAAGRTPRRSAACRRTRCRCAPSSRSGRRRPGRRACSTACRRPAPAIDSKHRAERLVGLRRAAGHDRRARCSAPSSPPDTPQPTKCRPVLAQRRLAAAGVGKWALPQSMMMSPVVQQRDQLVDHRVGRAAGLDHDDDRARPLQRRDEVGHRLATATNVPSSPCSSTSDCGAWRSVRLCSATVCPCRAKLRARLRPITASPVTPIVAPAA